jgi:RNA polymerase sigma factor (TIGR02999 family)
MTGKALKTPPTADVTTLLLAWSAGDEMAFKQLVPLVYRELHRRARLYMAGERRNHTLQTTALVNEAYLKLVDLRKVQWKNRAHFFAISAQLMRRILVDFARHRGLIKRGGSMLLTTLHDELAISSGPTSELIAIDDALKALESIDARKARVVELRFFGGLTEEETAEVLKISSDTVMRDWKFAKVWLKRELAKESRK